MERKEPGAEAGMIGNASQQVVVDTSRIRELPGSAPALICVPQVQPPARWKKKKQETAMVAQGRWAATPDRAPRGRFGPSPPHLDCGICKRDLFCF